RGDIAHSLKSVQLLGWSGQGFYRDRRKVYTPFHVSPAISVFLFIGMIIQIVNQNKGVIQPLSRQSGDVGLDLV
ncbi:MAG: hypothetical protein E6Y55_26725, partial [Klebsiella michiganensis]|nr:hypothetical protein [Klebsiella michiganensis]